eukprot:4561982-Karenia_brevis.AAC.1
MDKNQQAQQNYDDDDDRDDDRDDDYDNDDDEGRGCGCVGCLFLIKGRNNLAPTPHQHFHGKF